jgi:alkylation response protein AidB-like acyl-CoA dehydrogenase
VPAGAVASIVVAAVDGRLVLARRNDHRVRRYARVHGPTPIASWDLTPRPGDVSIQEVNGDDVVRSAIDEWKVLTAAALMGLARRAVEIGADYATTRKAFGTPIGTFQGVAHPLADAATDIDGGTLLARRAAWLVDRGDRRQTGRLARLAWGFCGPVATNATARAVHIHGGYGAALEYDIQLFHRRARAWSAMLGDPREQLRAVGDALLAERRHAMGKVG